MRTPQPVGTRGSLKWIQIAIESYPELLQPSDLPEIEWLSPLRKDEFAEYRDGSFLEIVGLEKLKLQLKEFWPTRGPQWDALGLSGKKVILVEAKAHLDEFFSPGSAAGLISKAKIDKALNQTREALNCQNGVDWADKFYQYANRLAHLYFLREHGVDAKLLFVSFINDKDMNGPAHSESWEAAFRTADYAMGLSKKHKLSQHIFHVCPDVSAMS